MALLPKFPNLPDPENVFSVINKTGDAIDKGLGIIDKVVDKFDQATQKFDSPGESSQATTTTLMAENKPSYSVSDKDTLLYQLDHLVAILTQLETHLSEGCKIMGIPCDCCGKHSLQAHTYAMETISIAARMGKETQIYQDISDWAPHIEEIDTPEKVQSGDYDETYRKESGTASKFRKKVQSMIAELKGGEDDDCPDCEEIRESISSFIKKKKRERGGE